MAVKFPTHSNRFSFGEVMVQWMSKVLTAKIVIGLNHNGGNFGLLPEINKSLMLDEALGTFILILTVQ